MVTSLTSPLSTLAMNSLWLGSSSRAPCPFADTNLQSITPRNTIDIQNRMVFAVELEFTSTSPLFRPEWFSLAAPGHFLSLPSLPLPCKRLHRQTFLIAPYPIRRRQAIADPYTVRCGSEPKVIGLQAHSALFRLVQQYGQAQRPRLAFAQPSQQKFLRHSAVQYRVNQQHIPPLDVGSTAKRHFAPRMTSLFHVANFCAYKVADRRCVYVAYQVCRKYKAPVQRNHNIQALAAARSGDLPA